MTEAEWLACRDPVRMTNLLGEIETGRLRRLAAALGRDLTGEEYWDRATERKSRLLAAACCRRIWSALIDPRLRHAVEVAERYADGEADDEALRAAHDAAEVVFAAGVPSLAAEQARNAAQFTAVDYGMLSVSGDVMNAAAGVVYYQGHPDHPAGLSAKAREAAERAVQAALIREVFGNPLRPAAFEPSWATPGVLALARSIYRGQEFLLMPTLADALQGAGCEDASILGHCRGDGPHVRGCWVLDLVLAAGWSQA